MLRRLKVLIQDLLARAGYSIAKIQASESLAVKQTLLGDAKIILDVGANIGGMTADYAAAFPHAQIHSFEPFSEPADKLRERFANLSRVQVHELAVAAQTGTQHFHTNLTETTNSLLPVEADAVNAWGGRLTATGPGVTVKTTTIDEFCNQHAITTIDLLKLDIQGGEFEALKGAERMLADGRIQLIFCEIILEKCYQGQQPLWAYIERLSRHGYMLVDVFDLHRKDMRIMQLDALFASPALAKSRSYQQVLRTTP